MAVVFNKFTDSVAGIITSRFQEELLSITREVWREIGVDTHYKVEPVEVIVKDVEIFIKEDDAKKYIYGCHANVYFAGDGVSPNINAFSSINTL